MKHLKAYEKYWEDSFQRLKIQIKKEFGDMILNNLDDPLVINKIEDKISKRFIHSHWMDIEDAIKSIITEEA